MITPNQSYLTKNMQHRLAACLAAFVWDIRGNVVNTVPGAWGNPSASILTPSAWRVDNMVFHFLPTTALWVKFSSTRWDPASDLQYGPKQILQNVEVSDNAKTKIVRNATDDAIHVAYSEEASLTNAFSSSITKGVTLDVTKEASVDTSLTVKGEYAGVGAEASVAAHFGISESKSSSTELGKEKSEEGTNSQALAIEFDAAARTNYLITVVKEHERTEQPFAIIGIEDFDLVIKLDAVGKDKTHGPLWAHCPHGTVELAGIDGLAQFMQGYDTRYPEMAGYWQKASGRARNGINRVLSLGMRQIEASGTNQESLESNADYKVESLGGAIPDAMAHLPVVNAEDV